MILLYSNNYAPKYDQTGAEKKPLFDVWRAGIVLDAKLERFGLHVEFRARDRPLRWMPVNSWLEEVYASADLITPESPDGPLVLKVGKAYAQFGKFWDNSFYGNIHLRDGLKLVPDWGLSLEGTLGTGKVMGLKYFAQYFVVDGQTSTASTNRDTISIVGADGKPIGARKRNDVILRVEPSWTLNPLVSVKLGGSFEYFIADYPDTFSPEATAAKSPIRDRDNTNKVLRYGLDITAQLGGFGVWGEYTRQKGQHTNAFPFAPRFDNAATPENEARGGAGSPDVTYWLAGANFTYERYTLQYNFSAGIYRDVLLVASNTPERHGTHKEWIHNPSVSVKLTDQVRILLEFPFWLRKPAPGIAPADPRKSPAPGKTEVYEKQVLATLHGKF